MHKLYAVDLWSDDVKAVEQALTELGSLCIPSDENWKQPNPADMQSAGAASAIVGAMKKWYNVPAIQEAGYRALANQRSTSKDFRRSTKKSGGSNCSCHAELLKQL